MTSIPLLLFLALASCLVPAQANLIPPGGCIKATCTTLGNLSTPTSLSADKRIAYIYGRFNGNLPGGPTNASYQGKGGPSLNYEVVPQIELPYLIISPAALAVRTLGQCCTLCAETEGCTIYQFYVSGVVSQIRILNSVQGNAFADTPPGNFVPGQQCYLLTGGTNIADGGNGTPNSGRYSLQSSVNRADSPNRFIPPAFIGGYCNPGVRDDPHFTGALGTRFDFNGEIGKSFNLISDQGIHISIKLGGYLDDNTSGATRLEDGKALRTWIKGMGFLWAYQGGIHSALLSARGGKDQARGEGFLSRLVLDGEDVPVPREGQPLEVAGFKLELKGVGNRGTLDTETFAVAVGSTFRGNLQLRPAHPLLQSADDAQIHFNLQVLELQATPKVHGVLGQTFRRGTAQQVKALEYRILNALLGGPVAADGASGKGFLDGEPKDYVTSGLTAADSLFSVPVTASA